MCVSVQLLCVSRLSPSNRPLIVRQEEVRRGRWLKDGSFVFDNCEDKGIWKSIYDCRFLQLYHFLAIHKLKEKLHLKPKLSMFCTLAS